MKILELCLSHGVGGLELYAARIARQLVDHGVECVAVGKSNTLFHTRINDYGIPSVSLKRINHRFPLVAAKTLANIIDAESVDIIHMHWGKDLLLAVLAKRFAKRAVKLAYTRQMSITRPKKDIYHRFVYQHVDLYLTITDELAKMARQYLPMPEENIRRLYYGVDKPPVLDNIKRDMLRQQFGVAGENRFAIGIVGRVEAEKGQYLLIEAMQSLKQTGHTAHLTIIGPAMNPAYQNQLEQRCRDLNLQDSVTFYGPHNNPIEIMGGFDTIVLATKKETFGLVLVEAMRNGVAVIGTNAGGVPEIIDHGETGLLYEPEKVEDLTAQLIKYIEDPEGRQRIAANGKRKADQLFTNERHIASLIGHFESLSH